MLEAKIAFHRGTIYHQHHLQSGAGECVWISGDSGIGKSSLMQALAGLIDIEASSHITWQQRKIHTLPTARRPLVLLPQGNSLIGHLPLWQNVALGHVAGWRLTRDDQQRALFWLDQVGLGGMGNRYPAEISGGQAQRASLARCFRQMQATDRRLLLLDEPTSALDNDNQQMIMTLISQLQQAHQWTVLCVAHQPIACDRHWSMTAHQGRVQTDVQ